MTLSAGTVSIGVKSDTKGFGDSLRKGIMGETSGLGGIGKVMGGALLGGMGIALAGLGAVFKTGFDEAKDASAGTAQLAAGIKSTGNAAKVSVDGLNKLASSIQGYSGQTDDSIVKSEQLLLTFTKIKNNGPDKIFDLATVATANMAAKLGGDASGAAIQLGKALNDPIKGITALSRVGVSFTQGQKDSIAAMVKLGDTAGAQKIILGELNTEFGGAAKAAGESLPGQMAKAKRSFEDVSQSVVEGLLPVVMPALTNIANTITKQVIPAVQGFVAGFKDGTGAGGTFRDILKTVGDVLGKVAGFIKSNVDILIPLGAGILGIVGAVKAWNLVQLILNAELLANPIGLVVVAIAGLAAGLVVAYQRSETFRNIVNGVFHGVAEAAGFMWNDVLKPTFKFLVDAWMGVAGGILKGAAMAFGWIPGIGPKLQAASKSFDAFRDQTNAALDGIKDKVITVTINQVLTGGRSAAKGAGGSGGMTAFAGGTDFAPGGLALVGERGPEIVNLQRGAQVIPAGRTEELLNRGGGDVVTNTIVKLDGRVLFQEMQRQSIAYARRNGTSGLTL